ncbi:MAG: DUF3443 domain-containing protein [Polyangiales bacterium]
MSAAAMFHTRRLALVIAAGLAVGCGGGSTTGLTTHPTDGGTDTSTTSPDGATDTPSNNDAATDTPPGDVATDGPPSPVNFVPVIVDEGPGGIGSVNVPFISVTLCIPGTSTCKTIDHVGVDTGSSGLRVLSSALGTGIALPQATASTGASLVECFQFADGYTWGSVRMADVRIGGEIAGSIPIQVIGDPAFTTVPSDCSSSGPSEDTLADFGSDGLIGINQIIPDCGSYCSDTSTVGTGAYYACTGATCAAVAVPESAQVPNPIARFATDNNGALLTFPTVPAGGAATLTGTLTFGIGTASNNALGSATVLTVDGYGNFTTVFNGQTMNTSFIDSGTNTLSFNDSAIAQCTASDTSGFDCPASLVDLTAQNKGLNGVTSSVAFSVESADTLFSNASFTAFDDLATPGIDNSSFDWGFPFFIGRTVFVAFDGATTPGGAGPYVAY